MARSSVRRLRGYRNWKPLCCPVCRQQLGVEHPDGHELQVSQGALGAIRGADGKGRLRVRTARGGEKRLGGLDSSTPIPVNHFVGPTPLVCPRDGWSRVWKPGG